MVATSKKELVGLVLMGFGNIAAIYSATCSSYFSTYKFSRKDGDPDDVKIAIVAGIYGFILTTAMIAGVYFVYETPMVFILLMAINLLLFGLYYDVITAKIGLWDWMLEQFGIGQEVNTSTPSGGRTTADHIKTY